MKKILVMVLCIIMAAMPAVAEGISGFTVEPVENLAAELGFEGATGEESIYYCGDGYYICHDPENLTAPYLYVPEKGWVKVDGSTIDETWATTKIVVSFETSLSDASNALQYIEECGSAGDAFINRFAPVYYVKGDEYIIARFGLDCSGLGSDYCYGIDLKDYTVFEFDLFENDYVFSQNGRIYRPVGGKVYEQIDKSGNVVSKLDLSAIDLNENHGIQFIFNAENEDVILYRDNNNGQYAAWIDKDGNLIQNNYLGGGDRFGKEAYYFEEHGAVVYCRNWVPGGYLFEISKKDGTTDLMINDGSELYIVQPDSFVYDEDGRYESGFERDGSITPTCVLDDNNMMVRVSYDVFLYDYSCKFFNLNIATMEMTEIDLSEEEKELLGSELNYQYADGILIKNADSINKEDVVLRIK